MPRALRFVLDLGDEAHTLALAAALARVVPAGGEIHLIGDLAAGKTAFARGFLRALGHRGAVKSPTFTLVESYEFAPGQAEGRPELRAVHHFDLYRLADPGELHYLGFEDYHQPDAVCLVEWPSRGGDLSEPAVSVELVVTGLEQRRATLVFAASIPDEKVHEFETLMANIK